MDCIVDDLHLHYQDEGKGPTLLLLHGWGNSLHTFDLLCAQLRSDFRIVRLDLPGFGKSQPPLEDWFVRDYATLVAAFVRKLDLDLVAIIGHSFGGRIAIKGLATSALHAERLILIASAGIVPRPTLRTHVASLASRVSHLSILQPIRPMMRQLIASPDYQAAGTLRGTLKQVLDEDLQADAARLDLPTLLVWGEDDPETPRAYGQIFHERIVSSQIEVIPDAGHFVHETHVDRVTHLMQEFLQ